MFDLTPPREVPADAVVHVSRYLPTGDGALDREKGFFRFREASGILRTVHTADAARLEELAAGMGDAVYLTGDRRLRRDWIARDAIDRVEVREPGRAHLRTHRGETILVLDMGCLDAGCLALA